MNSKEEYNSKKREKQGVRRQWNLVNQLKGQTFTNKR